MRREVVQIWTQALRSGEFSQGKGYLDNKGKVCVLGVLCQLALTVGVCDTEEVRKQLYSYDQQLGRIPKSVQEWAEMYGQNGEMKGEFVNLTFYNDVLNYTLPELAEVIQENWNIL